MTTAVDGGTAGQWPQTSSAYHVVMVHNDAVSVFGRCACECHRDGADTCWCGGQAPDPYAISHNDRVRHLGGCQCRGRACTWTRTDPEIARLLHRKADAERDRRIRTGRVRGSDIAHIARHPQRYPQYFSGRSTP